VKTSEVMQAWGSILSGRSPSLSIELTRECPLRCPGCYAYEDKHLGLPGITLRQLADYKGRALMQGVLSLIEEHRPLHVSFVGGDPLVRFRELEELLPDINRRGIHSQVVTSAFRIIPEQWNNLSLLNVVVSVDGLQPEHDVRRKPATYDRILKNIAGCKVTIHCTVTGQMMQRPSYVEEFVRFWSARKETKRIWFSLFTPQLGPVSPEILTSDQRWRFIEELLPLLDAYPLIDMKKGLIDQFHNPPASPRDCIFARTTVTVSADLKTRITPCQFGGAPDCSQCGCVASMALSAVGHHRVIPGVAAGQLFTISELIGRAVNKFRSLRDTGKPDGSPETVNDAEAA